jgi:hypothetical protein
MSNPIVPKFGEILAPYISTVPEQAVPNFLALLERGAAQRYRDWAEKIPAFHDGLIACSKSEDRIADIVESIFPLDKQTTEQIQGPLPEARATYNNVFDGLPLADQLAIQADAELQGAEAWRAMLSDDNPAEIQAGLKKCVELDEASSHYVHSILDAVRAAKLG